MRILAVTNLYPNPLDPHRAAYNRLQFGALAERHEVRVIAPIAWTDEVKASVEGRTLSSRSRLVDEMIVEHPRYWYPPKVLRGLYGHFFWMAIEEAFARGVRALQPDVVLACWAYPDAWAAAQLCRAANLPLVVKVHGSDILTAARISGREDGTIEALAAADGVIAVSEDLRRHVVGLGIDPERVQVVYDGIDRAKFRPGSREEARAQLGLPLDEKIVLFVGNLLPVKGLDVLLRALDVARCRPGEFGSLASQPTKFRCFIVGQGPLREALEREVAARGLSERVTFMGARPHAELPDWYRAADLLVLPSRSEGVPNVILESAACGTPVVASDVGGISEVIHFVPHKLVPKENVAALAAALRTGLQEGFGDARAAGGPRCYRDAARDVARFCQDRIAGRRRVAA